MIVSYVLWSCVSCVVPLEGAVTAPISSVCSEVGRGVAVGLRAACSGLWAGGRRTLFLPVALG